MKSHPAARWLFSSRLPFSCHILLKQPKILHFFYIWWRLFEVFYVILRATLVVLYLFGKWTCSPIHNVKTVHAEPREAMPPLPRRALGGKKESHDIIIRRSFDALFLTSGKFATFRNCRNIAMVNVLGMCYTHPLCGYISAYNQYAYSATYRGDTIYISAWTSRCFVQQFRAMRRPPDVEQATVRVPRLFVLPEIHNKT